MTENKPTTFFLVVLSTVFVFASIDTYAATDTTVFLNSVFMLPVREYLFSFFDVLVLLLCFRLLATYEVRYKDSSRLSKTVFWVAVICMVLNLANPNNQFKVILGLPLVLLPKDFVFIFFLFCMLFLDSAGYTSFTKRFFAVTVYLVCLRSLLLILMWLVGEGNRQWFGQNITVSEGDTLILLALCQTLLLAVFLARRQVGPLLGWLLLLAVQVFSFRRSGLAVALVSNFILFFYYILIQSKVKQALSATLTVALLLGSLIFLAFSFLPADVFVSYIERYTGPFLGGTGPSFASDSGHFIESVATMANAIESGSFWGFGNIDQSQISVQGATLGYIVHNVYAATWLYEGVYNLFFYALMLFCIGYHLARIFLRGKSEWNLEKTLVRLSLTVFMVSLMIIWFYCPLTMAETTKMRFLWVLPFSFILRPEES